MLHRGVVAGDAGQASESLAPSHWALGDVMKLTVPGVAIAVPAQPADFQAKAESDSRIQLSWLLPPQERIIKYELVYWAAEDEGQQVSLETRKGGRKISPGSWWSVMATPRQGISLQLYGSFSLCGSIVCTTPVLKAELLKLTLCSLGLVACVILS